MGKSYDDCEKKIRYNLLNFTRLVVPTRYRMYEVYMITTFSPFSFLFITSITSFIILLHSADERFENLRAIARPVQFGRKTVSKLGNLCLSKELPNLHIGQSNIRRQR